VDDFPKMSRDRGVSRRGSAVRPDRRPACPAGVPLPDVALARPLPEQPDGDDALRAPRAGERLGSGAGAARAPDPRGLPLLRPGRHVAAPTGALVRSSDPGPWSVGIWHTAAQRAPRTASSRRGPLRGGRTIGGRTRRRDRRTLRRARRIWSPSWSPVGGQSGVHSAPAPLVGYSSPVRRKLGKRREMCGGPCRIRTCDPGIMSRPEALPAVSGRRCLGDASSV